MLLDCRLQYNSIASGPVPALPPLLEAKSETIVARLEACAPLGSVDKTMGNRVIHCRMSKTD